ncbi:MAG TPA: metalloregulator ArsR/SmtB family transcription factor [Mycobacteriales bacterium]|nr:metalloregulator ArsR/SmtB family transcription factor [Mycobacteriales bacterium]
MAERTAESRTRECVARLLLERGPQTAATLGQELGVSPAAIRRHLDALLAEGHVEAHERPPLGPRGRGRPAKVFSLTESGRESFPHAYDDLAVSALRFLAAHGGEDAVRSFAEERIGVLEERLREQVGEAPTREDKINALAGVLTEEGYAASVHAARGGEQLCQHHCPVAHVAAEFPQLCEAETAALARALGTHVQRLATIARGDGMCTMHVPISTNPSSTTTESASGRKPA